MIKIKTKSIIVVSLIIIISLAIGIFFTNKNTVSSLETQTITVKNLSSTVLADGTVASESEATLHFQTGGNLIYLPLKEGDKVYQGQTIAKLDTYALQRQLTAALNNYQATRDNFDQSQENDQNGVAQGQQKYYLDVTNKVQMTSDEKNNVSEDIVKRLLDQQQLSLNNSVANVELASYALQLASLQSPITGTLIHEDIKTTNTTISSSNSFVVADTSKLIFKSYIPENYIEMVKTGDTAIIKLKGDNRDYQGVIEKIYPGKTQLSNGQSAYQIDIKSDDLIKYAKYNQNGSVIFNLDNADNITVVPSWLVINKQFIWVKNRNNYIKKTIVTGKNFNDQIQIISGLNSSDQVVTDPKIIIKNKYLLF